MKKIMLFLIMLFLITSCKKIEWQEENVCDKFNCAKIEPTNEDIYINISKKPMLGEEIEVIAVYDSGTYEGNIKVIIEVPFGYSYISGNKEFNGFVRKYQEVQLKARIKAIEVGGWTINAFFEHDGIHHIEAVYAPVVKEGVDESMLPPLFFPK